jgi:hypothetical protein
MTRLDRIQGWNYSYNFHLLFVFSDLMKFRTKPTLDSIIMFTVLFHDEGRVDLRS